MLWSIFHVKAEGSEQAAYELAKLALDMCRLAGYADASIIVINNRRGGVLAYRVDTTAGY